MVERVNLLVSSVYHLEEIRRYNERSSDAGHIAAKGLNTSAQRVYGTKLRNFRLGSSAGDAGSYKVPFGEILRLDAVFGEAQKGQNVPNRGILQSHLLLNPARATPKVYQIEEFLYYFWFFCRRKALAGF